METSTRSALLPLAPSTLCFDKNEFMKNDFSVDKFVADCRRRVQLETLRQDLEVYFKLLKNAMIELINKDYADFVNLSSNLVGMDKSIIQLRDPLALINENISEVSAMLGEKMKLVKIQLEEQKNLANKQDKLGHMMGLLRSVEKIEQIQASEDSNTGQVLERIAGEFNQLQNHAGFCKGLPVLNQVRPRISEITGHLQQKLEQLLILGIDSSDVSLLHRCLNSYALIGKTKDAEKLIQSHLVRGYITQVVDEQNGNISTKGLQLLFGKILDFIPTYCKLLCDITAGRLTNLGDQYRGIAGYDFVVRSVWPEIVQCLENKLSAMFSPGDPDLFHKRYKICTEFISDIERQCGSQASVSRLRQSEEYIRFIGHWSLPVYFQMRFQEIGGKLEEAFDSPTNVPEDKSYRLHASSVLYSSVESCWRDDVFLFPLIHRFWKVTMQCLSRYLTWVNTLYDTEVLNTKTASKVTKSHPPVVLGQLVGLTHDLSLLQANIKKFDHDTIQGFVEKSELKDKNMLNNTLKNLMDSFESQREKFIEHIITTLASQAVVHLRQAQDVPRLFRRTNRDAPTKPSSYVTNVLKPAIMFVEENSSFLDVDVLSPWMTQFSSIISEKYYAVVSDVLTSVKKMEESLMRLQKMRAGKSSGNLASMDDNKLSDDDKIRMQLHLDVVSFKERLVEINVSVDDVNKLNDLLTLVTNARQKD